MSQIIERSLSYDVLDKTMTLFWEKGYFNTSIEDITEVSGLNRAAIYKYFGGKDELFLAMLKRFRTNITAQALIPIQNPDSGLYGLKLLFTQYIKLYNPKVLKSRGCFLASTASNMRGLSKDVGVFIKKFFGELRGLIHGLLNEAKTKNLLKPEIDIDSVADFMLGNILGIMTLSRTSVPKKIFENHIKMVTNYIDALAV
jgi:TetR/AcrR family transcriptional repressor of nem operon